ITRCSCRSSVSVTSGTRPTIPNACFSASVKAVDSLSAGSWSSSNPCLLVVMTNPFTLVIPSRVVPPPSVGRCDIRVDHLRRLDDTIEFGLRDKAQLQRRILEREVVVHGVVGDLRRLVVADDW